jgi:hypothetical protein
MQEEGVQHMPVDAARTRVTAVAGLLSALLVAILCVVASRPGLAAKADGHIEPNPHGTRYRLYVLGDSLAANLADGLVWALRDAKDVQVVKRTRAATGLVRDDVLDWTRSVADLFEDEKVDIAVIAIGGNDRQDIRHGGRRHVRFTAPWRMQYRRRVDQFMRTLASKNVALYWVSLPPVRFNQMRSDYRRLNAIYRDLAGKHGIKLIDIFDRFRSPSGGYTAYGAGVDGETVRLRDGDGIHFTLEGSRTLGRLVADVIRRDLQVARSAQSASPDDN